MRPDAHRSRSGWSLALLWICGLSSLAWGGLTLLISLLAFVLTGPILEEYRDQAMSELSEDRGAYWQEEASKLNSIEDPDSYDESLLVMKQAFMAEAMLRLDPALYLEMPFARQVRLTLFLRMACSVAFIIGGLFICAGKRFAWKALILACPISIVAAGIEGVNLNRNLPMFWDALRVDMLVAHRELAHEVGEGGFWSESNLQFINQWQGHEAVGLVWAGVLAITPLALGVILFVPVVRRGLTGAAPSGEMGE